MKLVKIKCNNTQIGVKTPRPSSKSVEISSDCVINCIDAFRTPKFIKIGHSCQSIVTRWEKLTTYLTLYISELGSFNATQTTSFHEINYVVIVETTKSIKRHFYNQFRRVWSKLRALECDDVRMQLKFAPNLYQCG